MRHRVGSLLAAVLLLSPFAHGADAGGGAAIHALLGRRWAWERFVPTDADAGALIPAHRERYWVELLPEGKLSLQADCNRGFGTWTEGKAGLELKPLGTTLMACVAESLDSRFLQLLRTTSSVSQDGAALVLRGPSGVLRLAEVSAEGLLAETAWTLLAVENTTGKTAVPSGRYGVEFKPEGTLRWTADCQHGGGTWKAGKGRLLKLEAAKGVATGACVPLSPGFDFARLLNETGRFSWLDAELLLEGPYGRLHFRTAPTTP